jgi:hydrogenase expression/formation protein HypC
MCLAVPGQIIAVTDESRLGRSGMVSFEGVQRNVNLVCVPEAGVGDYVLVHAGVAIGRVDAEEAAKTLELLSRLLNTEPGGAA